MTSTFGGVASLLLAILLASTDAKISDLMLRKERRHYFVVSSFGLLQGGNINVTIGNYKQQGHVLASGFSIHQSNQKATEYDLSMLQTHECFLTTDRIGNEFVKIYFNGSNPDKMVKNNHVIGGVGVSEPHKIVDADGTVYWTTMIDLKSTAAENIYTVAFHHCDLSLMEVGSVSAEIQIVEVNPGPDYLGAGLAPLPQMYFTMAAAFGVCALAWLHVLWNNRTSPRLYRVHYLMFALIVAKTVSLLFHGIDYHFIKVEGSQEEGWAVIYYVIAMAKGLLLFVTILLIGAGYGFVKHALSKNERAVFLIIIPLQILTTIAGIVIEESAQGSALRSMWKSIGLLVDLICCGAILFPVVWSIKHLRDASESDGKVAASLSKLRLFRRFYIMVLAYIYTTRIFVYLIENSLPFRYEWLGAGLAEAIALIFYVITGVMFSPEEDNEYLKVPAEDPEEEFEHIQMDNLAVNSGVSEGMKRVTRSKKEMLEPDF
eukprot:m.78507 g.78507  ORF g.78507 m.78507 type:complete len:488 (+) comp25120_c0_seq1:80-1543(+)